MKLAPYLLTLTLFSCAERPLVYTGSQFSIHASGLKNVTPEKLSVGYDRTEYAWLPRGGASSVQGTYDTEYRYPAGVAINELLITGPAASGESAAGSQDDNKDSDLIVSTNTKTNLGLEAMPSDGNSASFNFGFKRSVLALFPKQQGPSGELPSTYTDLTLHANSFLNKLNNPKAIAETRQMQGNAFGARIVQTIATGEAAENLARTDSEKLRKRIVAGLIKVPDPQ